MPGVKIGGRPMVQAYRFSSLNHQRTVRAKLNWLKPAAQHHIKSHDHKYKGEMREAVERIVERVDSLIE